MSCILLLRSHYQSVHPMLFISIKKNYIKCLRLSNNKRPKSIKLTSSPKKKTKKNGGDNSVKSQINSSHTGFIVETRFN